MCVGFECLSLKWLDSCAVENDRIAIVKKWMFSDFLASSIPRIHLCVGVCVASFGWVFVPHGRHPAGLAPFGKGANIQDTQHTATHTQLILQDEAVLGAQRQARSETSIEMINEKT